jgi:hypothetical protein
MVHLTAYIEIDIVKGHVITIRNFVEVLRKAVEKETDAVI